MSQIAIFGTGTWATALGQTLLDNGHKVILVGREPSQIDDINLNHRNSYYFGDDLLLSPQLTATCDYAKGIEKAEFILLAVPTCAIRDVLQGIKPLLKKKICFINASKGFDPKNNARISEVIREEIPVNMRTPVVSLIGPSHAEEVILRQLTTLCSVSQDEKTAETVQILFSNEYFRVYTLQDEVGAEYGVALKNAIALASGALSGLGYGDNARAALVTRGLAEMVKFGIYFGGQTQTYLGLTGLGDLMVTCNSHHSRNFMAGFKIGQDDCSKNFLQTNKATVEGIRTALVIHSMAEKAGIDMPIINAIYRVLYCDERPSQLIKELMVRPLKKES